jgi:hypothetical protein
MSTVAHLKTAPAAAPPDHVAGDFLEGAASIAEFLGPPWTERKVYHAREVGGLPIRRKAGIGLYAFKSELLAALKAPETLPDLTPKSG